MLPQFHIGLHTVQCARCMEQCCSMSQSGVAYFHIPAQGNICAMASTVRALAHHPTQCSTCMHAGMSIRAARAEGNALGKGPLVFHMRPRLIAAMRAAAATGDTAAASLELSMFRCGPNLW